MDAERICTSIGYTLLLAGCACCDAFEVWAMAFGMGESQNTGAVANGFLLLTALSALGFLIAAAGAFARMKFFSIVALASAIGFLPCSVLFLRQWINSNGLPEFAEGFAPVLALSAGVIAAVRLREHRQKMKIPIPPRNRRVRT